MEFVDLTDEERIYWKSCMQLNTARNVANSTDFGGSSAAMHGATIGGSETGEKKDQAQTDINQSHTVLLSKKAERRRERNPQRPV